ncbi:MULTISPECIES: hypothetical protein [unclassified Phenylobacterium]|uniref:hypothetical protein n=1 Tax=unclassified Phenylobacterium TaxID=2640670 RepID=UPI00083A0708|nr:MULTISPECIES: hypothetical protein [unclassified Phenylobacterium]
MRLANHIFYALAALIGVSLVALRDPSVGMLTATAGQPVAACRSDHLERPCDPGVVGGVLRGGHVVAR